MKILWLILLKLECVIDVENGGAKVMRKDSMMISGLNEENYTFPSAMTLRFQAVQSACNFQRKYWIGSLAGLLLIIAGIVSAFVIVDSKNSAVENTTVTTSSTPTPTPIPQPAENYSKNIVTVLFCLCVVYVFSSRYIDRNVNKYRYQNLNNKYFELFSAKLLVVSGVSSDGYVMNSEVIDLYDTGVTCKPWPDLPVSTNGAVGGFINDHLLICGGATPTGLTSICHAMTPLLITDNPFNLSIASYNSAGVVLDQDKLLISGGFGNERNIFMVL